MVDERLNPIAAVDGAVDEVIDAVTGQVNRFIDATPAARSYEDLRTRAPRLEERALQTPLGGIRTPEVSMPQLGKIELNPNGREALKAALAIDISSIVGLVPVVGDVLADVVEDTHGAKLRDSLTAEEMDLYSRYDKAGPSTLAMLRTLVRSSMRR